MKKVLSLTLVLALCLSVAACGKKKTEPKETSSTTAATAAPTTESTLAPTSESTAATDATSVPTEAPTEKPTAKPATAPSTKPTEKPTVAPTTKPTTAPTSKPTEKPTEKPTVAPTTKPTEKSTTAPTTKPTEPPHTHTWKDATCQSPKTCTGCGATETSVGTHSFVDGICTVCKATDILNPNKDLKICGDTNPEYISQAYIPYDEETITARGISFWDNGGYGEGVYCLLLDAYFSANEEDIDASRPPVAYSGKEYYRIGGGMSPAEVNLTDTEILITDQWYSTTIKMVLMGNGNLKVTESTNSNYPVDMILSTSWSYLHY